MTVFVAAPTNFVAKATGPWLPGAEVSMVPERLDRSSPALPHQLTLPSGSVDRFRSDVQLRGQQQLRHDHPSVVSTLTVIAAQRNLIRRCPRQ